MSTHTLRDHQIRDELARLGHRFKTHLRDPFSVDTLDACRDLRFASNKLHRIGEMRCSGIERWDPHTGRRQNNWTDEDEAKADRDEKKARARAERAMRALFGTDSPLVLRFQGDPRGAAIQVVERDADLSTSAWAYI